MMDGSEIAPFDASSSKATRQVRRLNCDCWYPGLWLMLMSLLATERPAYAKERTAWLTGPRLQYQRRQPVSVNWPSVAVRIGLSELADAQQVAILLDRRVDPERQVALVATRVTLDDVLGQIAEKVGGGAAWLGPLVYIGPPDAARRLRTLAALRSADVRVLPKETRSTFERAAAWQWEDFSEPRQLVADLAAEAKVELQGLDLMPHDLWPAADLPPLSWSDRLTLVANEFDLTFEFADASHLRLAPVVGAVVIERSYPGGRQAAELARRWKRLAPAAEVEIVGGKLIVRGRLEDHELIHPPKSQPVPAIKPGAQVYTLTVPDQPLAAVLDKLRESSIEITVDEAALKKADLSLQRRVSFSVERASLEELLEAALKPAGLTFRREGKVYKIVPASTDGRGTK